MIRSPFSRREVLVGLGSVAFACTLVPSVATAAEDKSVPVAKLLADPVLPDVWLGSDNAPVTVIEYASMTCTHCAAFHHDTYPALKSKYIDTGKVRFSMREMPLDPLAAAAFMVARRAGDAKRYAIIDALFDTQQDWAFTSTPVDSLKAAILKLGVTSDDFDATLKDDKLFGKMNDSKQAAVDRFGVHATPTFFLNDQMHTGGMSAEDLDRLLQPLLAKG